MTSSFMKGLIDLLIDAMYGSREGRKERSLLRPSILPLPYYYI
jgi:hypothetical protein